MKKDKNMKKSIGLKIIAILILGIPAFAGMVMAQVQPYQLSGTAEYVDTTAYDTVSVPYVKGSNVAGFITNEDETNDLVVYFAKRDSVSRDPNSYVKIGPGKRLKFSFQGRKIFRKASADSVYTQVVFGDGMDLGSGGSVKQSIGTYTADGGGIVATTTKRGIITTASLTGGGNVLIDISNPYVGENSVILYSVKFFEENDIRSDYNTSHGIVLVAAGNFTIRFAKEGGFIGEAVIFYEIIN